MKKKNYEKPTMVVVELQPGTAMLQAVSGEVNRAQRSGYGTASGEYELEW